MPFVYVSTNATVASPFVTHATPLTEIESYFLKPGSTRNAGIQAMYVGGRAAGDTSLSGIAYRLKKWTTTSSSAGTAITPVPVDIGMQACKATAGGASAGVTPGTGGPSFLGGCTSGAAGPGGWTAPNPDSVRFLEAADNKSFGLHVSSGSASKNYEFSIEHVE